MSSLILFNSVFWTKKLIFMHLHCIQSIEGYKCCKDMFQLQMHNTVKFLYQGRRFRTFSFLVCWNALNFYGTLTDIALLNKRFYEIPSVCGTRRLSQATLIRKNQMKTTNATSDIDSLNSLYFHSKGDI